MGNSDSPFSLLQVLSNADLRAKYDQHGVEGLDVNFMDSAEFFSMLFGSERFEHLLGELSLAQMTRSGEPLSSGKQEQMQLLREERLAANLKALLRRWVSGEQRFLLNSSGNNSDKELESNGKAPFEHCLRGLVDTMLKALLRRWAEGD